VIEDPVFVPASTDDVESGVFDLSTRPAQDVCALDPATTPCTFNYCGAGQCGIPARTEWNISAAGCACPDGEVARTVTSPAQGGGAASTITCEPATINVLDGAPNVAACAGVTCGDHGACVAVNGFATCACEEGHIAVNDALAAGGISCVEVGELRPAEDIRGRALDERSAAVPARNGSCATSTPFSSAALLLTLLLLRRRR
jgi:hypothetical protein